MRANPRMRAAWFVALSCLVGGIGRAADEPALPAKETLASDPAIEALLAPIREKYSVPGLVAGIVEKDRMTKAGAVGVRKMGADEPIRLGDKLHLGSCTKAMTATRLAMLVEESRLSWKSTVAEVFSDIKSSLHDDYQHVTLEQLLSHRAGLPANASYWSLGKGSNVEQREELVKLVLSKAPAHAPGSKFLYSNVGYIVAGHMAERITGKPWEELMTAGLFEPLAMKSAGYGAPGTKGAIDQPWGHSTGLLGKQALQSDNPPVLGPAGTVHCSLEDWGKFAALHLAGARGEGRLLKPETFRVLHTPPEGADYALGWGVVERPWARGKALTHSGSNTMWFSTVWIAPERNLAFMAVTNEGGDKAPQACNEAIVALLKFHDMPRPDGAKPE